VGTGEATWPQVQVCYRKLCDLRPPQRNEPRLCLGRQLPVDDQRRHERRSRKVGVIQEDVCPTDKQIRAAAEHDALAGQTARAHRQLDRLSEDCSGQNDLVRCVEQPESPNPPEVDLGERREPEGSRQEVDVVSERRLVEPAARSEGCTYERTALGEPRPLERGFTAESHEFEPRLALKSRIAEVGFPVEARSADDVLLTRHRDVGVTDESRFAEEGISLEARSGEHADPGEVSMAEIGDSVEPGPPEVRGGMGGIRRIPQELGSAEIRALLESCTRKRGSAEIAVAAERARPEVGIALEAGRPEVGVAGKRDVPEAGVIGEGGLPEIGRPHQPVRRSCSSGQGFEQLAELLVRDEPALCLDDPLGPGEVARNADGFVIEGQRCLIARQT